MSYQPQPYPPYPGAPVPQQGAGWFRRNRAWFIPTLVIGILLLAGALFVGIFELVMGILRSSEPYQHAVQVATHDPRVESKLGHPMKPGWMISGEIKVSGSSGYADLTIPMTGRLGNGTIYLVAKKSADRWSYQTLEFGMEGESERVNLLPESDVPSEEK